MEPSSGSLFSAWGPAIGGLIQFGSTRHARAEGLPKAESVPTPSAGNLTAPKPLFSGAGTTQHIVESQPDGAARKRRLLTFSKPPSRRDGDESLEVSCGEDGCDTVSALLLSIQPPYHGVLELVFALPWRTCSPSGRNQPTFVVLSALGLLCCTDAALVFSLNGCHYHSVWSVCGCEQPPQLLTGRDQHAFKTIAGSVRYLQHKCFRVPHRRVGDE